MAEVAMFTVPVMPSHTVCTLLTITEQYAADNVPWLSYMLPFLNSCILNLCHQAVLYVPCPRALLAW